MEPPDDRAIVELADYVSQRLADIGRQPGAVADGAGIHRGQFSAFLKGKKGIGKDKLVQLAQEIEVPVGELLRRAGFEAPLLDPSEILLTRSAEPRTLTVVTDARFIDSALFAWLISTQPLRPFNIECDLQQVDWDLVPAKIEEMAAVGFYNRRISNIKEPRTWEVERWADIAGYKGYAVIARKGEIRSNRILTLKEVDEYLDQLIARYPNDRHQRPTIISFGGDTNWRIETPLNEKFNRRYFDYLAVPSADQALEKFDAGQGDLFIGGLPQRWAARTRGMVELISFENNPLFFSFNSLVYATEFIDTPKARAILGALEALWFHAVSRLRVEPTFRKSLCEAIPPFISKLGLRNHNISPDHLAQFLPGSIDGDKYELFPSRPTELLDEIVRVTARAITICIADFPDRLAYVVPYIAHALGEDVRGTTEETDSAPRHLESIA